MKNYLHKKSFKYIGNLTTVIIPFIHWGTPVHSLEIYVHSLVICPFFYLILCQTFNKSYNYQTLLELCSGMSDLLIKQLAYSNIIQGIK